MELSEPNNDDSENDDSDDEKPKPKLLVDIDLDLSAFANARRYYDQKKTAAKKQQKTIESQGKAFKSAEKKTKQTLKEMQAIVNINKARKVYWFEKFFWFISSENYLVIGGRDMIQNEMVVKRYMRQGDVYVHADIHGASSVVIKNPTGEPIPPKTLNEAGTMAICYSVAWEAKVVTKVWWVHHDQVSKTAPAGEYLTAGSFMVRGKKNYLPPCQLVMGFSFLFKLEESSIEKHLEERKIRTLEEDLASITTEGDDVELPLSEGEDDEEEEKKEEAKVVNLEKIEENDSEEGSSESESDKGEDGAPSFPDTEIKIHHTGRQVSLETHSSFSKGSRDGDEDDNEEVVYLGDDKPVVLKKGKQNKGKGNSHPGQQQQQQQQQINKQENEPKKEDNKIKRGQKAKLKKIKEKYKDQDEEERKLVMEIYQSAGTGKQTKKNKKKNKEQGKTEKKIPVQKPKPVPQINKGSGDEEEEEEPEPAVNTDLEVLNSLTGIPHPDDELLFAIPVVAPYNTLHNYKFKVKLTPGNGKRGKAARTALTMFLKDRTCSQREKELLKGVKDELLARNLPGKVKVSAPQLYKK